VVYKAAVSKNANSSTHVMDTCSIEINSCCSISIEKMKEDFVKGTWILQLEDERGNYNNVLICNTLYAQDSPYYFYHLSIGVKLAQTEIEHITSSNVTK